MKNSTLIRSLMIGAAVTVLAGEAYAGAFGIREQSAYSQGASFAGNAACGESIQGTYWNSAAITCLDGKNYDASAALIVPDVNVTTKFPTPTIGLGDAGSIGNLGFVPSSASNWQINDRLYIGMTTNGPYGLGNKTNFVHAGDAYFRKGDIFSLNFNPVVGYKVNDYLAIGAGIAIQYFDLKNFQRALAPGAPVTGVLEGDDWGVGFTLGAMLTPSENTTIGIGYRSGVSHTLEGTFSNGAVSIPIQANMKTPDLLTISLRQRINETFTLLGTVEWTKWSNIGTVPVTIAGLGATLTTLPLNYKDGWFFSVGGEYKYSPDLTLRAGLGYEISPIKDDTRSVSLPDDNRIWLSTGFTYDYSDRLSFNGAFSYVRTATEIAIQPGNSWFVGLPYYADVDANVYIFSAGLKYKFGHHVEEPIVTKY